MLPERLEFLNRFNNLYQVLVNSVKENKLTERDFYMIIIAKAKSMNRERRELLNNNKTQAEKGKKSIKRLKY